jgi:hypothetical protein
VENAKEGIFIFILRVLCASARNKKKLRAEARRTQRIFLLLQYFFNAEVAEGRKGRKFLKFVFRVFRVFRLSALKNNPPASFVPSCATFLKKVAHKDTKNTKEGILFLFSVSFVRNKK